MKPRLLTTLFALLAASLTASPTAAQDSATRTAQDASTTSPRSVRTAPFTEIERVKVLAKIEMIAWRDQQFRRYTANGTLDEEVIAKLRKMNIQELMKFKRSQKRDLSKADEKLLWKLQRRNDKANHDDFVALVEDYGYPSPERLGVKRDRLFALLLHPPVDRDAIGEHVEKMTALLKPEVLAKNMPARMFAMFCDNMQAKIIRGAQLYGTNKRFDTKTMKEAPPIIADIEKTNAARREIGLAPLKEGEYELKK